MDDVFRQKVKVLKIKQNMKGINIFIYISRVQLIEVGYTDFRYHNGGINMKPTVLQFHDDVELKTEIDRRSKQGESKNHLYVMSHDDDRTERVADSVAAGKLGEGLSTEEGNVFTKKGDELRGQLKELGFSTEESSEFENALDHGIILLIDTSEA